MMQRRIVLAFMILALGVALLPLSRFVAAQEDGTDRRIEVGEAVTGRLDAENFAESFVFEASEGNTATLTATTSAEELSLALILTAPNGEVIGIDGDLTTASVATLANVALPENGSYVITVMRGTGAEGDSSGDYQLALTGTITAPPADGGTGVVDPSLGRDTYVQLDNGTIDIQLTWNAAVDMNLEVRDPIGGAIFAENRVVPSGGEHSGNVNQDCSAATADAPTEEVTWTNQSVPVGSYEILIYYPSGCDVNGPQSFTLSVAINGDEAQTITGLLNPSQVYVARAELDLNKEWSVFNGGVNAGLVLSVPADATEITIGQAATGTISNDDAADGYTFEASAGENLSIALNAQTGSLDTLMILLDANGNRVADNDDSGDGSTNSLINFTAPSGGVYTVIATRYAQAIGGTEGNYSLTVSRVTTAATTLTPVASGSATPGTTLTQGSIDVTLTWATEADLQLLVRDPNGDSVFDDATQIPSGGTLDSVGNQNCVSAGGSPVSHIFWPAGRTLPTGTYEVEVWHQNACDDTSPVNFTLVINVNGAEIFNETNFSPLTSRFMTTFTIGSEGGVTVGEGDFFNMNDAKSGLPDIASNIATAIPLAFGPNETFIEAQGVISQDQKFVIYALDARADTRISVSVQATSGSSLDTALYVLGPAPLYNQLSFSDDIEPGQDTNSRITSVQLEVEGTYYIIVTHYGLRFGGTAGSYNLTITLRS